MLYSFYDYLQFHYCHPFINGLLVLCSRLAKMHRFFSLLLVLHVFAEGVAGQECSPALGTDIHYQDCTEATSNLFTSVLSRITPAQANAPRLFTPLLYKPGPWLVVWHATIREPRKLRSRHRHQKNIKPEHIHSTTSKLDPGLPCHGTCSKSVCSGAWLWRYGVCLWVAFRRSTL